ncbi:unnamed protein product [Euphydryas editha]|uniref:Uncharacterized protein n=1 Tax=Euphydryas editha TaxID=104508 RepID=A0AAU9TIY7_EUPED|nr:unnamed protein product [Euphydryas editha]
MWSKASLHSYIIRFTGSRLDICDERLASLHERLAKNLYLLYISAPVTNERGYLLSIRIHKRFSPTYDGRKIGGEPGRRYKGENKIKTAPANGYEVREKSTRKAGLMVRRSREHAPLPPALLAPPAATGYRLATTYQPPDTSYACVVN